MFCLADTPVKLQEKSENHIFRTLSFLMSPHVNIFMKIQFAVIICEEGGYLFSQKNQHLKNYEIYVQYSSSIKQQNTITNAYKDNAINMTFLIFGRKMVFLLQKQGIFCSKRHEQSLS